MVWIISIIYSIYFRVTCYFFLATKIEETSDFVTKESFPQPPRVLGVTKHPPKIHEITM